MREKVWVSVVIALLLVLPLLISLPVGVGIEGGINPEPTEQDDIRMRCWDYDRPPGYPSGYYENLAGGEGWTIYWWDQNDKGIYRGNPADRATHGHIGVPPNSLVYTGWFMTPLYPDPGGWEYNSPVLTMQENATGYAAFSFAFDTGGVSPYDVPYTRMQKVPISSATVNGIDIDLTWPEFHQFDNAGCQLPAVDAHLAGYLVYRSTTNSTWNDNPVMGSVSENPSDWVLVGGTENSPITGTGWTDSGILSGSGNTYYYSIKFVCDGFTQVGAPSNVASLYGGMGSNGVNDNLEFEVQLQKGWNLISTPLTQCGESIDKVLENITGKWNVVKYYDATDTNDPWKTYRVGASTNDLTDIDNTMGFWINITEPDVNLTVSGYEPVSTNINLYAGWNLVGYPSLTTDTVANALWGTGVDRVEVCNMTEPYLIKEVGPTYTMKPGEGYWVHVSVDIVWTVEW